MKLEAEVKRDIYKKLKHLETSGYVLWFERLQSGQIHNGDQHIYLCRPGTPDFIVVMENKNGNLTVIFLEVKREGVFKTREGAQMEWRKSHDGIHEDILYIIAQSVSDIMDKILMVGKDRVAEIEF